MQEKLKNILLTFDISEEIIDTVLAEFSEEYILKTDAETMLSDEKQKLLLDTEVQAILRENKAKNPTACIALIDFSGISFEKDEILGLKEQIASIKKENPYLFEESEQYAPKGSKSLQNFDDLTDDEYFNFLKYRGGQI